MSEKAPESIAAKKEASAAPDRWAPLTSLRQEIDRLFDDFDPSRWPVPSAMRAMAAWPPVPAMDLVEKDGAYEVTAELPGIDLEDIDIRVSGDNLVIKGEKREDSDREEKDLHVTERRYGSFQRTLRLPDDVDAEGISATCAKGVLKVTLPRSAEAKANARKIEVKAG